MMDYKSKKVLVAGATGLVGSNLIIRLLALGAKIRATFHNRSPVIIDDRIEYIRCDLTKAEDCRRAVEGIEYVFMCAAVIGGAAVMSKEPISLLAPNVIMPCSMLEAAYFAKVKKYLTFGSTTAYPVSDERLIREDEMLVDEPYEKYFLIGWHYRITEKLCEIYSEKADPPMPCIILRPTNIYGPRDNFDLVTSHVAPALIRKVVERHNPIDVWGKGDEVRDLIYVDDLIDAVLLAMEKVNSYDPINIGLGKSYSVKEILWTIFDVENYHPSVIFDESKPTMIPKRYVDISKAERVLGWKPKTGLREGIRKTIEWYRGYYESC